MFGKFGNKKNNAQLLDKGIELYQIEKYDEAIVQFSTALNINEDDIEARLWRGKAWCAKNMHGKAEQDLLLVIRMAAGADTTLVLEARRWLSVCYYLHGQHDKSETECRAALLGDPECDWALFCLARIAFDSMDNTNSAAKMPALNRAVEICNSVAAWMLRARAYRDKLKNYPAALADWNQALALSPGDCDVHYHRGLTCHFAKQYKDALADFEVVLKSNPDDGTMLLFCADSYSELGEYPVAFDIIEKLLVLIKNDDELHKDRQFCEDTLELACIIYGRLDKIDLLLEYTPLLLDLNPRSIIGWSLYGHASYNRGKYQDAHNYYNMAIALEKKPAAEWYYRRGFCHIELGKYARAVDDFDRALEAGYDPAACLSERAIARHGCSNGGEESRLQLLYAIADCTLALQYEASPKTLRLRADCYKKTGEIELALRDLEQIVNDERVAADREFAAKCARAYGTMLTEAGHHAEAIVQFDKVLAEYQDSDTIWLRGKCHYQLGEIEKARADFELALDAEPDTLREWYGVEPEEAH